MTKLVPLSRAIDELVHDGDTLYASGFTHLIPFAAGHEVIRQGKKNLVLARATPDLIYEQMVLAGCARKIIFSYMGNPGVGSLRILRSEIEKGNIQWEEFSHFGMISRLQAGAAGLPFMPMNPTGARNLEDVNPLIKHLVDPYTGKDVVIVPALNPDVGIIHVQRADTHGNAQMWGIIGEQKEVAFASKRVILTAEEIVDETVIRSDPNRTIIPGFIVNAVCYVPHACHPSYAQGFYDRDNDFYLEWDKLSESPDSIKKYMEEWVWGVTGRDEYWDKLEPSRRNKLMVAQNLSKPVNYGMY